MSANKVQTPAEIQRIMETGRKIVPDQWKSVESFDDVDEDEYESDEEELYIVLDLGAGVDTKSLLVENRYQLIGLDTPMPFLKLGSRAFQGQITPLIGDEVILGFIRNQENPHNPSRPPIYSTSERITFQPMTMISDTAAGPSTTNTSSQQNGASAVADEVGNMEGLNITRQFKGARRGRRAVSNTGSRSPEKVTQPLLPGANAESGPSTSRGPYFTSPGRAALPPDAGDNGDAAGGSYIEGIEGTHDEGSTSTRAGLEASAEPKKKGRGKTKGKWIIDDLHELDGMDLALLAKDFRFELSEELQAGGGITTPFHPDTNRQISAADLERLRAGIPMTARRARKKKPQGADGPDNDDTAAAPKRASSRKGKEKAVSEPPDGAEGSTGEKDTEYAEQDASRIQEINTAAGPAFLVRGGGPKPKRDKRKHKPSISQLVAESRASRGHANAGDVGGTPTTQGLGDGAIGRVAQSSPGSAQREVQDNGPLTNDDTPVEEVYGEGEEEDEPLMEID